MLYYLWSALLKPNSAKFVWRWNKVHILMPILYYNEAAFFWYLALSLVNKICADHQQPLQAKRFQENYFQVHFKIILLVWLLLTLESSTMIPAHLLLPSKNKQRTSCMLFDSSEFQLALDHKNCVVGLKHFLTTNLLANILQVE